jgi:hypothetical protein
VDLAADRNGTQADDLRYLLIAETVVLPEHPACPLLGREGGQGRPEGVGCARDLGGRLRGGTGAGCDDRLGVVGRDRQAVVAGTGHVEAPVGDDPVEPRREGGVLPVGVEATPGRHEGLLHRILGVGAVTEDPQGQPVHRDLVPAQERLEGPQVTVARPGDQRGVVKGRLTGPGDPLGCGGRVTNAHACTGRNDEIRREP